ncbi:MAG TPA: MFS transporter [Bryobacteraceae bacterium]|nr:MFS transporter [Bryobacteraceae bacterium]
MRRAALLLTVNACMFVFGVVLLLMGSLLPHLDVSGARAGNLGSLPLMGILAVTVVIGPALDKLGAKPMLALGLGLVAAALAAMPSMSSYPLLAAAALVYGVGGGILNTATNAVVSELSAYGRGAALNLLGFSFSLGAVSAPLLMSFASRRFPASAILYLLAAPPAAVLLLILALPFPRPTNTATPLRELLRVLNHPVVWITGVLLFFESGNENCMFVWAGKMMKDTRGLAVSRADLALVCLSMALGAGRLLAALGMKRLGSRKLLLSSAAMILAGTAVVRAGATFGGMMLGFALLGLGMAAVFPTALAVAGDRFPEQTGTAFGAIMTAALVGGTAGPSVGGWLAGSGLMDVLFVPLTAAIGITVCTLAASRYARR